MNFIAHIKCSILIRKRDYLKYYNGMELRLVSFAYLTTIIS